VTGETRLERLGRSGSDRGQRAGRQHGHGGASSADTLQTQPRPVVRTRQMSPYLLVTVAPARRPESNPKIECPCSFPSFPRKRRESGNPGVSIACPLFKPGAGPGSPRARGRA
jgi:hypothetical protein